MSDKQELNMEEMGQVAGGWTFHSNGKYHTWLDGYEIKCPYCGNTSADVVKRIGAEMTDLPGRGFRRLYKKCTECSQWIKD